MNGVDCCVMPRFFCSIKSNPSRTQGLQDTLVAGQLRDAAGARVAKRERSSMSNSWQMPNQTMAARIPNTEYPRRVQQEEAACPVISTVCSDEASVFCYGVDCGRLKQNVVQLDGLSSACVVGTRYQVPRYLSTRGAARTFRQAAIVLA